jgi:hypothetical protein
MTIVRVRGVDCESGCWVEGHWGQYGPDHLADKVEGIWEPETCLDDPREIRRIIDLIETWGYDKHEHVRDVIASFWELRSEATDAIEQFLNEHTPDGWMFHWRDGEFFLSPICEDGDCDDDTCAHWD